MKIQSVNIYNQSFGNNRQKFDVQGHVGSMFDNLHHCKQSYNAQNIIDTVESNNVKKILVSSLSGLNPEGSDFFQSELNAAKDIQAIKGNDNVKIYPLISCQPGIAKDTSVIEKLLNESKFYGMKFHPTNTNKSIKDNLDIYSKYFDIAEKNGLPCVFHSTTDGKSDPLEIIKLSEKYPKHPVVLYHIDLMASPEQMSRTIDNISDSVKNGKSNLYVDISWLTGLFDNAEQNKNTIKQALEKIGPDRILFGSDAPIAEMGDKEKYGKFADFVEDTVKEFYKDKPDDAEKALNKIFYDNAEELFINKKWFNKPVNETVADKLQKSAFSGKKGLWIAAGIAAVGILALVAKSFSQTNKQEKLNIKPKNIDNHPSQVKKN